MYLTTCSIAGVIRTAQLEYPRKEMTFAIVDNSENENLVDDSTSVVSNVIIKELEYWDVEL
jgi:hypothetical protein